MFGALGGNMTDGARLAARRLFSSARTVALAFLIAGAVAASFAAQARASGPASAHDLLWIDEFRVGALVHDLEDNDAEKGADINLELLFAAPGVETGNRLADFLFNPRPHLGASVSAVGDTNRLYFGLTWDAPITELLFVEGTFGGVLHDGPTDDSSSSFGCEANFRESISLGLNLTERWRLLATLSHMSNGGICDENEGLTSAGARLGYKW